MSTIHRLAKDIIPKISAGEVVECPASVVKELLDNSLDAGASRVVVDIEGEGLKGIRVTDDGIGMSLEDVLMCFGHHTTSKISSADDLFHISTLGFRGEALSSISAVARVSVKSRLADSSRGHEVVYSAGNKVSERAVGMAKGTSVYVSKLFHNVPARKKFLRARRTEYRHILDTIVATCLANVGVGFRFSHNGKTILDISASTPLVERIQELLGVDLSLSLLPFEANDERFSVSGFLSKPQASSKSTSQQFLAINGRVVVNKSISTAIKDAYGTTIEPKFHPAFILQVKLDPGLVDVNVHPRKEQVSFWDETYIYDRFYELARDFLAKHDLTYTKDIFGRDLGASSYTFKKLKEAVTPWNVYRGDTADDVIQIMNTYIAMPYEKGLMLLDQHSAHEAILYSQFLEEFNSRSSTSIQLKPAIILTTSISQATLLEDNLDTLTKLGFEIDTFGHNSFRVTQVPKIVQGHDIRKLLDELLIDLQQSNHVRHLDELSHRTISFLACRSAIKSGEVLTASQMRELVAKVATMGEYTCPHGRPAKIKITRGELDRMFKRH